MNNDRTNTMKDSLQIRDEKIAAQARTISELKAALSKCVQMIELLPKDDIGGGIAALVKYCKILVGVK